MKEIEENDYNLNIPRYVDTFEEEEEINLDEIVEKIGKIDEEMREIDKTIKSFCDEHWNKSSCNVGGRMEIERKDIFVDIKKYY